MSRASVKLHDFTLLPWELARGFLSDDLDGLHENLRAVQNAIFGEAVDGSPVQTYTTTGTENNFQIASSTSAIAVSTTTANFTGFTGGSAGRELTIIYTGSGSCKVHHQNSSSTINYRVICPSVNGITVGQGGAIRLIYDEAVGQWRSFTLSAGKPIAPIFAAGNYSAATGSWTLTSGDVTKFTYSQINKQLLIDFELITTTVSATPATLNRILPAGFTITKGSYMPILTNDNGTKAIGVVWADPATDLIKFYSTGALAGWATATNTTGLAGQLTLEID